MVVHAPSENLRCIYYKFEVHFIVLFQGLTTDVQFGVLLQSLLPQSSYCLCPGLPEELRESVDFECKSARKWGFPLQRTDHVDCQQWFQAQMIPRLRQEPTCDKCKSLSKYLRKMLRRRASLFLLQHVNNIVLCHRPIALGSTCPQPLDICVRVELANRSFLQRKSWTSTVILTSVLEKLLMENLWKCCLQFSTNVQVSFKPCLLKLLLQESGTISGESGSRMSRNICPFPRTEEKTVSDNEDSCSPYLQAYIVYWEILCCVIFTLK